MWEFWSLLLLLAILAVFLAPRFIRSGPRDGAHEGTVLITGVSPPPDTTGMQYVTITGVLHGPTIDEHEVYQRLAVDVGNWPRIGELLPVRYSPRNPDKWSLVPQSPPESPPLPSGG